MGNEASTYDDPEDKFDGIDTLGYRVLGVQPNSPASSAGLVSFFDFLVGCNGRMLLGRSALTGPILIDVDARYRLGRPERRAGKKKRRSKRRD